MNNEISYTTNDRIFNELKANTSRRRYRTLKQMMRILPAFTTRLQPEMRLNSNSHAVGKSKIPTQGGSSRTHLSTVSVCMYTFSATLFAVKQTTPLGPGLQVLLSMPSVAGIYRWVAHTPLKEEDTVMGCLATKSHRTQLRARRVRVGLLKS